MRSYTFQSKQVVPIPLKECWDFFSQPSNLGRITPPGMGFEMVSPVESKIYPGQIIIYKIKPLFGFPVTWVTEITNVREFLSFIDIQRMGPYKFWHHRHFFREVEGGVEISDHVCYSPPYGILGQVALPTIRKRLNKIFDYRRQKIVEFFK